MKQNKFTKSLLAILFLFPFISNCDNASITIALTPTLSLTPLPSVTPTKAMPTHSPADSATLSAEINPLPTAPQGYPSPFPPFGNRHYTYESIRFLNNYIVRDWYDPFTRFSAITISKVGQPQINLEDQWLYIDELSVDHEKAKRV